MVRDTVCRAFERLTSGWTRPAFRVTIGATCNVVAPGPTRYTLLVLQGAEAPYRVVLEGLPFISYHYLEVRVLLSVPFSSLESTDILSELSALNNLFMFSHSFIFTSDEADLELSLLYGSKMLNTQQFIQFSQKS